MNAFRAFPFLFHHHHEITNVLRTILTPFINVQINQLIRKATVSVSPIPEGVAWQAALPVLPDLEASLPAGDLLSTRPVLFV